MKRAVGLASFIATPCNTLQHTATHCNTCVPNSREAVHEEGGGFGKFHGCCVHLVRTAVCCSALQCVAVSFMAVASTWYGLQSVAVCCSEF